MFQWFHYQLLGYWWHWRGCLSISAVRLGPRCCILQCQ